MKIVGYYGANHMDVQFEDGYIATNVTYQNFKKGNILNHNIKQLHYEYEIGEIRKNYQGCKMQLLEYINRQKITVQFLDEYKTIVATTYKSFINGKTKNPYFPSVCGVGIIGNKYKIPSKEYYAWADMIRRSCNEKFKNKHKAYKDVTCCKEWLLFENFYEWIHNQENFDKWYKGKKWCLDKDILKKHNKIYCPENCCLTSNNVNCLFERNKTTRGNLPIGVHYHKAVNKYQVSCKDNNCKTIYLGVYDDYYKAFDVYKQQKEKIIKQVAEEEFKKGNITQRCYEAMINYKVEFSD